MEKTLLLGGIGGRGRRGWQRMRWLDGITDSMDVTEWTPGVGDGQGGLACCDSWGCKESDTTELLNWTELIFYIFKLLKISVNSKLIEILISHIVKKTVFSTYLVNKPVEIFSRVFILKVFLDHHVGITWKLDMKLLHPELTTGDGRESGICILRNPASDPDACSSSKPLLWIWYISSSSEIMAGFQHH